MKIMSDAELMNQVMNKDRGALENLYDRYVRLVYSFAWKAAGEEALARTIVQAVFARLWTTEKGYDENKGSFVNWLLTITRNCAIDEIRKERKYREWTSPTLERWEHIEDPSDFGKPERAAEDRDQKERIQAAMRHLTSSQAQLLQLLYWEGYSLRDIAGMSNEPLGTIKSRLHQALKKLRHHLDIAGEDQIHG